MPKRPPFPSSGDGPSGDATVLLVERPGRPAFGCAWFIVLFLAAITGTAFGYAIAGFGLSPSTGQRVASAVAGTVFLALLALLIVAVTSTVRNPRGLAVDEAGLWWAHRAGPLQLPWSELAAARLLPATGPKRGQSGQPTVELFPTYPESLAGALAREDSPRRPLREKLSSGEPPEPELPSLRFAFRLPDDATAERARTAIEREAPDLRWLPEPAVIATSRRPGRRR